jgi:hypothetical protein
MGEEPEAPAKGSRFSHRGLLWAAVLALAITLPLAGYALVGDRSEARAGDSAAILADWRSFPVTADPRPPVLIGPTIIDPQSFPSNAHQEAYLTGQVDLAAVLPASPTTAGGYPVIPAQAALDRLRRMYPAVTIQGARTPPRLRIVAVALSQASFDTDRGLRRLPAWRLDFDRIDASVWVLAVEQKALWTAKPTSATDLGFRPTLNPDGRSLTLGFVGGPDEPTPCGIAYTASAEESATAVVIVLHQRPQRKAGGEVACSLAGYPRTVTVRLATALGARVLLTPYGVPMQVRVP